MLYASVGSEFSTTTLCAMNTTLYATLMPATAIKCMLLPECTDTACGNTTGAIGAMSGKLTSVTFVMMILEFCRPGTKLVMVVLNTEGAFLSAKNFARVLSRIT